MTRESDGNQGSDSSVYHVPVKAHEGVDQVQQLLYEKFRSHVVCSLSFNESADRHWMC